MEERIYEDDKITLTSTSLGIEKGRGMQISLDSDYAKFTEKEIQTISDALKEWLNKDFDAKDKYEQKIGELQTITSESAELARQIYILLKDEKSEYKREIIEDIIDNLRRAVQKVGWIDTRIFDNSNEAEIVHDLMLEDIGE